MKKIIALIIIGLTISFLTNAQQLNTVSQYSQDLYLINPAYAGVTKYLPITATYKKFWSGLTGSPSLQTLSGHMAFADNMGAGGKIFNYTAGPVSKTGIEGTYAYSLNLNGNGMKLAFGLSAQLYQYYLNKSALTMENPNDYAVMYGTEKMIVPDFNFGTFFYDSEKHYYAGISIMQLMGRKVSLLNKDYLENNQVRNYYFNGGYIYEINDNLTLEPSLLAKFIEAGLYQVDINVNATIKKLVNFGLSYRTDNAVVAMLGVRTNNFTFGYAYDYTLSAIKNYTVGSHEIMFIYKIGKEESSTKL